MHAERNNKPKLEETKPKLANQNDHDRRRNSEFRLAMKSRRTAAATAIHDGGRRKVIPDFEQRTWCLTSGAISADMPTLLMPRNCEKILFAGRGEELTTPCLLIIDLVQR